MISHMVRLGNSHLDGETGVNSHLLGWSGVTVTYMGVG